MDLRRFHGWDCGALKSYIADLEAQHVRELTALKARPEEITLTFEQVNEVLEMFAGEKDSEVCIKQGEGNTLVCLDNYPEEGVWDLTPDVEQPHEKFSSREEVGDDK